MKNTFWPRLILFAACLVLPVPAGAGTVETTKKPEGTAKIAGLAMTAARWTGWINVADKRTVLFELDFTDANSSCTAVSMVCETSQIATTTNDAGRDLHMMDCASGICDSTPLTYCYGTDAACGAAGGPNAAPGSKSWTWTVTNIYAQWLNCKFSASGTPAAADVLTVYATGVTP